MTSASLEGWDTPLSPDERDAVLSRIVEAVTRRGLQTPLMLALEIHRPLAFTFSQSLIVTAPLLAPLLGLELMQRAARLLQDPSAYDELIARIEGTV